MTPSRAKEPLIKRLIRWIVPDQRVATRYPLPALGAYLGLVRSSKQYRVADISIAGFYMITDERWIVGTGFPVTLEREDEAGGQTLTVVSTVVRSGTDGVGFTFLHAEEEQENDVGRPNSRVDLTDLAQFLNGLPLAQPTVESLEHAS